MNPLNLEKALQLYTIIGKHLPEKFDENLDVLDFVGTIVNNIKESGNHRDYLDSVLILTEQNEQDVLQLDPVEVLNIFTQGLMDNQIESLKQFCESINHG